MTHTLLGKCRAAALAAILTLSFAGCNRQAAPPPQKAEEEKPQVASLVHTGDPKSEAQLVSGFYGIEQNAWRWTAQQFSVVLHPPAGAAQKGATLSLQLAVPDAVPEKLKTITLAANISGTALPPETYSQAGRYTYTRNIAPNLLAGDMVRIDFQLDKALPPTGADVRQLGIIVNSVGLDAK